MFEAQRPSQYWPAGSVGEPETGKSTQPAAWPEAIVTGWETATNAPGWLPLSA